MEDSIEIPVTYKGNELVFNAEVKQFGYVHQIVLVVNNVAITIESDEEGNYRALGDPEQMAEKKVDTGLVKAILEVLETL